MFINILIRSHRISWLLTAGNHVTYVHAEIPPNGVQGGLLKEDAMERKRKSTEKSANYHVTIHAV